MHMDNSLKWTSGCSNKGVTLINPPSPPICSSLNAYLTPVNAYLTPVYAYLWFSFPLNAYLTPLKCGHICCWSHLRVYNWSSEKSSQMLRIWQFAICAIFDKTGRQLWKLHNYPLNLERIFATSLCTHWGQLKLLKKLHRTHWGQLKLLKNCINSFME